MASLIVLFMPVTIISLWIHVFAVWIVFILNYNEQAKKLLLAGIWSMFMISLLDTMAYTLFDAFINTKEILENFMANFGTQVFTLCFLWIVGKVLKRMGKGRLKNIGIPYMLLFTGLVTADTYVLTVLGSYIINTVRFEKEYSLRITYIIVVLGMFFQIMLVFLLVVSRNDYREKEKLAQKYLENQVEHYRYLEQRELETKRFRHDLRSHMFALQSYMQKKQYGEMEEHLTQMYGTMEAFEKKISVNNNIVDAILNKYDAECKRQGIEFVVKGHFPVNCDVSVYDLCTIFSNLLSNAVEAVCKIEKRQILLDVRYTDDELLFYIENDYEGTITIDNDRILTKKENPDCHGMGLDNVKACIKRNRGYIYIETVDQKFIVKIRLRHTGDENENSNSG